MSNSKENKQLNRKDLKAITGGATIQGRADLCHYISNGQYIHGCPEGQTCQKSKISHDPLIFGYKCEG